MHDYIFTFITSMAINEGLVPQERGEKMMRIMLAKMKEQGYDGVYGVPGQLLLPLGSHHGALWDEIPGTYSSQSSVLKGKRGRPAIFFTLPNWKLRKQ